MARYSTSTSIYVALPGLTNNRQITSMIEYHADRVSGMVNAYVGQKYQVSGWTSTASTPQSVLSISDRLVAQAVMRSVYTKDAQNANEWVNELGEQALEELKMIASGELAIIADNGQEATRATLDDFVKDPMKDYTPVFDMDDPTKWIEDQDLLDNINSNRS